MNKKQLNVAISTDYITLGQFLKITNIIQSGGEAKQYLATHTIIVDGVEDNRRGRKLRDGTLVEIGGCEYKVSNE